MYETFYGFESSGFKLARDHRLRFSHDGYTATFGTLLEATRQREGFVVLTGAVGTGKTTLIDDLAARLQKDGCLLGKVTNCRVDADELPRLVGFAFGLKAENIRKARLLIELKEHLVGKNSRDQAVILMIDEAQDLSVAALEELHLLFDLIAGQGRTVHILLVGQELLRERLRQPDCEQIQQLVVASCKLTPLSLSETRAYIAHELRHIGWRGDPEISAGALRLIHERTGGVPRLINLSMGHLLLHGSLDEVHMLESHDVESVLEQIGKDHPELLLDTSEQPSLPQPAPSQLLLPLDARAAEDTGPRKPPLPKRVLARIKGQKLNSATQAFTDWFQLVTGWDWKWALAGLSAVTISAYMTFVISFDGDPSVPSGARELDRREQTRIAAMLGADQSARKSAETAMELNASTASVNAYREVVELPEGVDDTKEDLEPDLVEERPATVRSELATDVHKNPHEDTLTTVKSAEITEAAPPSGALPEGQNQQGQANHEISKLLVKAERALSKDKLTVPSGDNAYAYYRTVLARDPDNALASAGVRRIVHRYRQLAEQQLGKGDPRSASLFASRGLEIRPRDRQLLAIKRRAAEPRLANQERESPEILKRIKKWFRSVETTKSAFLDQDE